MDENEVNRLHFARYGRQAPFQEGTQPPDQYATSYAPYTEQRPAAGDQRYPGWSQRYSSEDKNSQSHQSVEYNSWNLFGSNSDFFFPATQGASHSSHFGHYEDAGSVSLSQPDSTSGSESGYPNFSYSSMDGLNTTTPLDFNQASESGREIYTQAYNLHSHPSHTAYATPAYDLFGSRDVLHLEDLTSHQIQEPVFPQSQPMTPPVDVVSQAKPKPPAKEVKPSYSQVAKHKIAPTIPSEAKLKHTREHVRPADTVTSKSEHMHVSHHRQLHRKGKAYRSHTARKQPALLEPRHIHPDSRYGLDTFDDLPTSSVREDGQTLGSSDHQAQSPNASTNTKARDNADSLTASTSINAYDHPVPGPGAGSHFDIRQGDFTASSEDNKEASNENDDKEVSQEKVFFDPRRIFQNNIPNNQPKNAEPCTGLNNSKPPSGLNRPRASCYINNDLRDGSKQTNRETNYTGLTDSHSHQGDDGLQDSTAAESSSIGMARQEGPRLRGGHGARSSQSFHDSRPTRAARDGPVHRARARRRETDPAEQKSTRDGSSAKCGDGTRTVPGFRDNKHLLGEEAMKRLFSCKGKDPYSILGLRSDASSEDIKKYYRKQAVLVHPDKNQQPGAEEAFKILGHAFDLIGEPDKRNTYDTQRFEAEEAQDAMHEFADLLSKLHEKMQEAANMMRCDNCGGKHKRILTDIPTYAARFCDRCNIRHFAKEGDVWAESSMLGFRWHFYACMEGKVYNISEWASCKSNYFKQMQANSHQVMYKLHTGGGRQHRNSERADEADLQHFINHLLHQAAGSGHAAGANYQQDFGAADSKGTQGNWGAQQNNAAGPGRKGRRRRKRH